MDAMSTHTTLETRRRITFHSSSICVEPRLVDTPWHKWHVMPRETGSDGTIATARCQRSGRRPEAANLGQCTEHSATSREHVRPCRHRVVLPDMLERDD